MTRKPQDAGVKMGFGQSPCPADAALNLPAGWGQLAGQSNLACCCCLDMKRHVSGLATAYNLSLAIYSLTGVYQQPDMKRHVAGSRPTA